MDNKQSLPDRAILIVNAASRAGAEQYEAARDALVKAGLTLIDAKAVRDPSKMSDEVKKAVARAPMVVVGGGDGTLSKSVDHFLGSDTVFAVLPMGTANSFARAMGLPLEIEEAVDIIANGQRRRIDLGAIDGDYFANSASIGLSPMIADSVPDELKKRLGRFAYLIWGLRCAIQFKPFRLHVDDGKTVRKLWSTEVRIANGGHFGGVELVEGAELDSGEIVIEAVDGKSLVRLAWSWLKAALRLRGLGDDDLVMFRGSEFKIRTWPRLHVAIDGEATRKTPVTVRIAKGAIEVAAPGPDPQPSRDSADDSRSASADRSA